jgi:hypothetical protein
VRIYTYMKRKSDKLVLIIIANKTFNYCNIYALLWCNLILLFVTKLTLMALYFGGSSSDIYLNSVFALQKTAIRAIFNLPYNEHCKPIFIR